MENQIKEQSNRENTKLTTEEVMAIKIILNLNCSQRLIGDLFGVSQKNISLIHQRKTWKHLN